MYTQCFLTMPWTSLSKSVALHSSICWGLGELGLVLRGKLCGTGLDDLAPAVLAQFAAALDGICLVGILVPIEKAIPA